MDPTANSNFGFKFHQRDEFDYKPSLDYLGGGGLGREILKEKKRQQKFKGKYDLDPVDPPDDENLKNFIMKTANAFSKSEDPEELLRKICEVKDKKLKFVWDDQNDKNAPFFRWARHCIEREVKNWEEIRPVKIERFSIGEKLNVTNLVSRADLNGKFCVVKRFDEKTGRYEVALLDGDDKETEKIVKIRRENLLKILDLKKDRRAQARIKQEKQKAENLKKLGLFPDGVGVEIVGLESEQGRFLNGSKGTIRNFDFQKKRYAVLLNGDNLNVKMLKPENVRALLPPGWSEFWDESSKKFYFVENETGKSTWEHPVLKRAVKLNKIDGEIFVKHEREGEGGDGGDGEGSVFEEEKSSDDEIDENFESHLNLEPQLDKNFKYFSDRAKKIGENYEREHFSDAEEAPAAKRPKEHVSVFSCLELLKNVKNLIQPKNLQMPKSAAEIGSLKLKGILENLTEFLFRDDSHWGAASKALTDVLLYSLVAVEHLINDMAPEKKIKHRLQDLQKYLKNLFNWSKKEIERAEEILASEENLKSEEKDDLRCHTILFLLTDPEGPIVKNKNHVKKHWQFLMGGLGIVLVNRQNPFQFGNFYTN